MVESHLCQRGIRSFILQEARPATCPIDTTRNVVLLVHGCRCMLRTCTCIYIIYKIPNNACTHVHARHILTFKPHLGLIERFCLIKLTNRNRHAKQASCLFHVYIYAYGNIHFCSYATWVTSIGIQIYKQIETWTNCKSQAWKKAIPQSYGP